LRNGGKFTGGRKTKKPPAPHSSQPSIRRRCSTG
jgi:hypothetical protein